MAESPVHRVVEGDTLKDLAYKYGCSVKELRELNGWERTPMLYVGMQLNVPSGVLHYNPLDACPAEKSRGHIAENGVKVRHLRDCQRVIFEGRYDDDRHTALEEMMNWLWEHRGAMCIDCITYDNEESGEERYIVIYEWHVSPDE